MRPTSTLPDRKFFVVAELFTVGCGELPWALRAAGRITLETVSAALWFGEVDDLWRMGAPVGTGGPWKDTSVKAGEPSDPYLMAGYRTKSVTLSHNSAQPVTFEIEVDFAATGDWSAYARLVVKPGKALKYRFPAGYSAHWVRLKADRAIAATATFNYEP